MPLVKKQSGWYWGSQGPFATKDKALQVARAAYANGYRQQSTDVITFRIDESTWEPPSNLARKFEPTQ